MVELYDVHRASDWGQTIRGVAGAVLIGLMLYLVMYFSYNSPPRSLLPRRGIASYLVVVFALTLLWRQNLYSSLHGFAVQTQGLARRRR